MAQPQHLEANYLLLAHLYPFPKQITWGYSSMARSLPPAMLNILCYLGPFSPWPFLCWACLISLAAIHSFLKTKTSRNFCEITFKIKCSPATFLEFLF